MAILLALQWTEDVRPLRAVICSDSSSSLISLKYSHSDSRPDVLGEMQQKMDQIQMMGLSLVFVMILSHVEIRGNETADKCAEEATKRNNTNVPGPHSKTEIKKHRQTLD